MKFIQKRISFVNKRQLTTIVLDIYCVLIWKLGTYFRLKIMKTFICKDFKSYNIFVFVHVLIFRKATRECTTWKRCDDYVQFVLKKLDPVCIAYRQITQPREIRPKYKLVWIYTLVLPYTHDGNKSMSQNRFLSSFAYCVLIVCTIFSPASLPPQKSPTFWIAVPYHLHGNGA